MSANIEPDLGKLGDGVRQLRGNSELPPEASIIVPVNAQADLAIVLRLVADLTCYFGPHSFEIILVVNNYPPNAPPAELKTYGDAGLRVVSAPNLRRPGEAVGFTARMPGLRAASSENAIIFDADCRVPNATALLTWYVEQFENGAKLAYTHVDHYDLLDEWSVQVRVQLHHWSRWVKRVLFRIPTNRGSNYAVNRSLTLQLYDKGMLADEMNVGPNIKATGGRIAYSGSPELVVLTSGRKIGKGWATLTKYLMYRLKYNLRVLPVRPNAARHTKRR